MRFEIVYEFGEITGVLACEQVGEQVPYKFRMRKGKTYCEIVVPVLQTDSEQVVKDRAERALALAQRAFTPERTLVPTVHNP